MSFFSDGDGERKGKPSRVGDTAEWENTEDTEEGRRFKVYFQEFQKNTGAHCQVVCFPHPSGSIGLRDGYIAQYKNLMAPIISQFS